MLIIQQIPSEEEGETKKLHDFVLDIKQYEAVLNFIETELNAEIGNPSEFLRLLKEM